jgi:hypothetical protein
VALFDRDLRFILPDIGHTFSVDWFKIHDQLRLNPRSLEEMTLSMAESMITYGIVKSR